MGSWFLVSGFGFQSQITNLEFRMPTPEFSVIIPVRNGAVTLGACLDGLSRQTVDTARFEVIVVDDGSTDGTAAIAGRFPVRLVQIEGRGAAAARNRGLRESTGDRILFLDADCIPSPDWLAQMTDPLASGTAPGEGACLGTVGRFVSGQQNWIARMIQIELDRRYERMDRFRETDFVNTATCAFLREALPEDPFDEEFGKLEDLELSFRLASEGLRMRYVPDAVVEHHHPESLAHHLRRRFLYGRFAPRLYRRYSGKALSDSSTPPSRRFQLVALGLAPVGLLVKWWLGVALTVVSLAFSHATLREAFRRSAPLGFRAPIFILGGNLAFLTGFVTGAMLPGPGTVSPPKRRSETSEIQ
jgi:glycosyltransferase involved in cell wall biosynthesis